MCIRDRDHGYKRAEPAEQVPWGWVPQQPPAQLLLARHERHRRHSGGSARLSGMPPAPARENLTRFAWLSIAAAVATIALKFGAYLLTGSVGLLSDAAESVVNLVAAFVALIALHVAAQPADVDHQFGHSKAEYFSAAVEGVMIFVAAIFILLSLIHI